MSSFKLYDYAFDEIKLETMRHLFCNALRENDDFPVGLKAELKRRVAKRNGETVAVKVANDIHTLRSVLEGNSYSSMPEMLSASKARSQSQSQSQCFKKPVVSSC